jgi:ABC-type transport system substrate-binding protein
MSGTDFYQSAIHCVMVNNAKKPFDDPRVRRAFHLVFHRPVLIEAVKDIAPMLIGGFIYPFSEFATPPTKLSERLGYQADPTTAIKEARQLMAAAGYANGLKGVDWLVRDGALTKLWAVAIQAMLKEALNVETTLRIVQVTNWFDDAQAGRFDLASSPVVSTLMDPSDYFRSWYGKDGPQNYSKWSNTAFQELVDQIDRELDETKRKPWWHRPKRSWNGTHRCSRYPGRRSTMPGTTTSRGITPTTTLACSTWCASIPSG